MEIASLQNGHNRNIRTPRKNWSWLCFTLNILQKINILTKGSKHFLPLRALH